MAAGALLLSVLPTSADAEPAPPPRTTEAAGSQWISRPTPGKVRKLDLNAPKVSATDLAKRSRGAEEVSLTLRHLDRDGHLTADAATAITDLDGPLNESVEIGNGEVTLKLPRGRYLLTSLIGIEPDSGESHSLLVQPLLDLQADTVIDVDARRAKPLNVTVPDPAAGLFISSLNFSRRGSDGIPIVLQLPFERLDLMYAGQLGPNVPVDDLTSSLVTQWARRGPAGDYADSPVSYNTLDSVRGKFFTGFRRAVRPAGMAKLVSGLYSTGPGLELSRLLAVFPPEVPGVNGHPLRYSGPARVTEYVDAGAEVAGTVDEMTADQGDLIVSQAGLLITSYPAGRTYPMTWNKAVLGPDLQLERANRRGDAIKVAIPMFADQAGSWSLGTATKASTRLFRDGKLLAETDLIGNLDGDVEVGPGRAQYRLESQVDRAPQTKRSTKIDAVWKFSSDTASEAGEPLPLWVVRFRPEVDLHNVASGHQALPFTVNSNGSAKVGRPAKPSVEISGDGGKTWKRASVVPKGGEKFAALFAVPAGARTISLRAHAGDSLGNTVDQTILDAYGVR